MMKLATGGRGPGMNVERMLNNPPRGNGSSDKTTRGIRRGRMNSTRSISLQRSLRNPPPAMRVNDLPASFTPVGQ